MSASENDEQIVVHAIAQRLCFFRNRDWRYDPGERQHEHWREKAHRVLTDTLVQYGRLGYHFVSDEEMERLCKERDAAVNARDHASSDAYERGFRAGTQSRVSENAAVEQMVATLKARREQEAQQDRTGWDEREEAYHRGRISALTDAIEIAPWPRPPVWRGGEDG